MYRIQITLVCCVLAGALASNDPTFVIKPDAHVSVGDALEMKCEVNEGAGFMASKVLRFVHKSAKTGVENTISDQGNLVAGYAEKGYSIDFQFDPLCSVKITIAAVTDDMDGEFICQVKRSTEEEILEHVNAPVAVLGGVSEIKLTVENEEVDQDGKELSFRTGALTIGCMAFGSNPQPDIHLKLDGEPLAADVTTLEDPDSSLPRRAFKGSVQHVLNFNHDMFNKKLECHAETLLPDDVTATLEDKSLSAVLKGIVDEPIVSCSNNTASITDRRVTLKCVISKVPKVKSVYFNVGNQYNVFPGEQAEDLTECKLNDLNSTYEEMVLQFYEMKDWHFTANIYLDVEGYDGSKFQYPVYLIKDNVGAAASYTVSFLLLAVSLVAVSFNSIRSS